MLKIKNIIKSFLGFILFHFVKILFLYPVKSQKRILFILNAGLGDLINATKIINTLNDYQIHEVYFLIKEDQSDLFRQYSGNIKFISYRDKAYLYNLYYRIRLLKSLRAYGFEMVFVLNHHRRIKDDEIALNVGAIDKIALNYTNPGLVKVGRKYFDRKYDELLSEPHEFIQKKYDKLLTRYFPDQNILCSSFYINKNRLENDLTEKFEAILNIPFVCIGPMASTTVRNWSLNNFKKVIIFLLNQFSFNIILLGSLSQFNYLEELSCGENRVHNLAGRTSIIDCLALLSKCKLFVGLDSGLSHLAYHLDIPRILILGGGTYDINFSKKDFDKKKNNQKIIFKKMDCFGCNWHCKYPEPFCLTDISLNIVKENIINLLGTN